LAKRSNAVAALAAAEDEERGLVALERAVKFALSHLRLDAVFASELTDTGEVYRAVAGDGASFGVDSHGEYARAPDLCRSLRAGEIPCLVCDAATDERLRTVQGQLSSPFGAFIAAPLALPDGRPFGTLCGLSHFARPDLLERDASFMAALAEALAEALGERREEDELRAAISRLIETEDIKIAFQPIIDLRSQRCIGVEALARFPQPFHEPARTFVTADKFGLRFELERMAIVEAWKILPSLGREQFLSLNVSPNTLVELSRRANLRDDLPLSQLVVEVTEHAGVDSYSLLLERLAPLRAAGLRIAVDDAGAGYASLRHVLELRPDFIKIDRSLIDGIAHDRVQRVAASAFQSIAADLRARVVAEGVERDEDLKVVRELGVDAAQGYLLGRPTTDPAAIAPWLGDGEQLQAIPLPTTLDATSGVDDAATSSAPVASDREPERGKDADEREAGSEWRAEHACSGLTSRLILTYVEREAGGHAVLRMLEHAGLSGAEERLRDENGWFSYETKVALWRAAELVLGDPAVARHAGEAALDLSVAMGLKRALRALGTPSFVYANVARANAKFNWAHELVVVERGSDFARLRYTDLAGVGYHRYDCEYTQGLLATVPQLFGLPPARVKHEVCGGRGAAGCEFDVRWTAGVQLVRRAAVGLAGACAAMAGAGALLPELIPAAAGLFVVGELALAARAFGYMKRRLRVLELRVREQDDGAARLLSSLGALASDLRLDEVLDQITAKAQTAVGGKQFALLLSDGDRERANRHSGVPARALAALESWTTAHRGALGERGTVIVDDLAADPILAVLAQDQRVRFGSICAAPLVLRDEPIGVLVALAHGSTVFLPDDAAALSAYAGHAAIALSNARLVERLARQAAEDPLTGLANQRAFREACASEFSRAARVAESVSIVMLDLDRFKAINDEHGHTYGDQVLLAVADALRGSIRTHDTAARLGGEEFAMLLSGTDADSALEIAERVRSSIADIPVVGPRLSCSAGVATATPPALAPADLLEQADHALYEAKRLGRDRTVCSSVAAASAEGSTDPPAGAASPKDLVGGSQFV
jgi:diguanylate cyclase (GGDEF)-like protein